MIRPEAKAALWRWREVLLGLVCIGLGVNWILTSFGAVALIGGGIVAIGAALVLSGFQRARFRQSGGGAGVVDVDERQITYFGPYGGGAMAVDELREVATDGRGNWLLRDTGGQALLVPMTAEGAEVLFDAFSALPGLSGTDLVAASQRVDQEYTVVWQRAHNRLH